MLAYQRNVKEIPIKVYKTKLKQYCILTTGKLAVSKRKTNKCRVIS